MEEAEQLLRDYQERLERVFAETHAAPDRADPDRVTARHRRPSPAWSALGAAGRRAAPTRRRRPRSRAEVLKRIGDAYVNMPEGFTVHPKLQQLLQKREPR